MKKLVPFLIVCALPFLMSCNDSSKSQALSPEVRFMADTMYAKRRQHLEKELDSLCELKVMEILAGMIDSLMEIEQRRIKELSQ